MRRQDLYGDDAVQAGVAGAVDLAHTAGTQRREDFIGTEPDSAPMGMGRGARNYAPETELPDCGD